MVAANAGCATALVRTKPAEKPNNCSMDSRRVADKNVLLLVHDRVAAGEKADAAARDDAIKAKRSSSLAFVVGCYVLEQW